MLSLRISQTLATFAKLPRGTIQFEVSDALDPYFALVLCEEPRWIQGIAGRIDAWISAPDRAFRALLSEPARGEGEAPTLEVDGDGDLVRELFEGLAAAKPSRSLLALRSGGLE